MGTLSAFFSSGDFTKTKKSKDESCRNPSSCWPCHDLSLSSAQSCQNPISYEQVMKAKGVGCDICTLVVTEIDKLLAADETLDSVVEFVEQLCSAIDGLFPGSGATCNALVETYLPQIIEGLVNNQLSPASVCGLLTLCP